MPASIRPLLSLLLLATAAVALGSTRSAWWETLLEPDKLHTPGQPASEVVQPPPQESVLLMKRIAAKTRIINLLRSGEMSLFQAAAWFRYLNTQPGDHAEYYPHLLPGASVEEKMCRQVICWLTGALQGNSPEAEVRATKKRLEEELAAHITRHGKVVLPQM